MRSPLVVTVTIPGRPPVSGLPVRAVRATRSSSANSSQLTAVLAIETARDAAKSPSPPRAASQPAQESDRFDLEHAYSDQRTGELEQVSRADDAFRRDEVFSSAVE